MHFAYDVLGRVLSKTYLSKSGDLLAEESFTYNGFHLLTETDKEGNSTRYSYDGSGRKIRQEFCGQVTDFSYDSLGWLATLSKHNGDNTLLTHYERDLEGRIIEKRKTDSSNRILYKINYSYDSDGNQETITRYINGKEAIDAFTYDSFTRLIQHQDAESYVTKITYDENFTNQLDQKVLQISTIDPHNITYIETQDALSRTVGKEVLSSQKTTIFRQEMTHDACGNLLCQKDHVFEKDQCKGIQTIQYTHTPDHRIATLTRAFGTKEERTTTYTYTFWKSSYKNPSRWSNTHV